MFYVTLFYVIILSIPIFLLILLFLTFITSPHLLFSFLPHSLIFFIRLFRSFIFLVFFYTPPFPLYLIFFSFLIFSYSTPVPSLLSSSFSFSSISLHFLLFSSPFLPLLPHSLKFYTRLFLLSLLSFPFSSMSLNFLLFSSSSSFFCSTPVFHSLPHLSRSLLCPLILSSFLLLFIYFSIVLYSTPVFRSFRSPYLPRSLPYPLIFPFSPLYIPSFSPSLPPLPHSPMHQLRINHITFYRCGSAVNFHRTAVKILFLVEWWFLIELVVFLLPFHVLLLISWPRFLLHFTASLICFGSIGAIVNRAKMGLLQILFLL